MLKFQLVILIVWLSVALATVAQPQQRIIIGLDPGMSAEEKQTLVENIEKVTRQTLTNSQISNESRWVIVLEKPLTSKQLDIAIERIQSFLNVKYVEPDQILSIQ